MPIHDYFCEECGHTTEKLIRARKKTVMTMCEECGGQAKRVISAGFFRGEKDWLNEHAKRVTSGDY